MWVRIPLGEYAYFNFFMFLSRSYEKSGMEYRLRTPEQRPEYLSLLTSSVNLGK